MERNTAPLSNLEPVSSRTAELSLTARAYPVDLARICLGWFLLNFADAHILQARTVPTNKAHSKRHWPIPTSADGAISWPTRQLSSAHRAPTSVFAFFLILCIHPRLPAPMRLTDTRAPLLLFVRGALLSFSVAAAHASLDDVKLGFLKRK